MPGPAWVQVATIVREADGSADANADMIVDASVAGRVLLVRSRLGSQELWRADDRGATWAFHTITGAPAATGLSGPGAFGGLYWIFSTFDGNMYRTSLSNPGPVWTTEATAGVVNAEFPKPNSAGALLFALDNVPGRYSERDNSMPGTWIDRGAVTIGGFLHFPIPGSADMFAVYDPGFTTVRLVRVTPNPLSFVSFDTGNPAAHTTWPRTPGAVLSANDAYVCSDQGASPGTIWETLNLLDAVPAWTARTVPAGFWAGVPGAANFQVIQGVAFARLGSTDYAVNVYFDNLNAAQTIRHAELMRFDRGGTNLWQSISARLNDGFQIKFACAGLGPTGLDFYAVTYDPATVTSRVYRFGPEQLAALGTAGPSKIGKRLH